MKKTVSLPYVNSELPYTRILCNHYDDEAAMFNDRGKRSQIQGEKFPTQCGWCEPIFVKAHNCLCPVICEEKSLKEREP